MAAIVASSLYFELIQKFPLRPIRSEEELDQATEIALELDFRKDLDEGGREYLEVLCILIGVYEDEHHDIPPLTGHELLHGLIEMRGETQADVARGTGIAESVLSELVSGKRRMGRKTIETLARHLNVDPGLFLDAQPSKPPRRPRPV